MFFADDSLFFFRTTKDECEILKRCFKLYENASGQRINFQKSSISLNANTIPRT
ncbi:hypothetical protein PTKIN_Ptkin06aG0042600 [Pterospermum kingtungense]